MDLKLGKLKKIEDLRKVWPHEASNFTPWLAEEENLALLGEAIGIDITLDETESSVGDFNVDIVASETDSDRKIIIENQLESTDHDHLGKLITYASGKSAEVIIWIVKKAREEHRAAIEWLNSHTDNDISFFLVEMELYQIGESAIAPHFNIVEKPNDWAKAVKVRSSMTTTEQDRYDYWAAFKNYAFSNQAFERAFKPRKTSYDHWMAFSIGTSRCHLELIQNRRDGLLSAQMLIPNDKELFYHFEKHKEQIEAIVGKKLDWREMENKQSSRILLTLQLDYNNKEAWPKQFDWAMQSLLEMKKAFTKYL